MNYVPMEMDANIQALMNIAERRLCMCADPITREYMEALVEEIRKYDEDIAWSLVPQCVRCGGCVEPFGNCQYYNNTFKNRYQTNFFFYIHIFKTNLNLRRENV